MNIDVYCNIYNHLVIDRRIDTDEARCLMTDIEMELEENPELDPWDIVEELV